MDQAFVNGLFENQTVVITGGGSGIGKAVALEVGLLGANVAICGRRTELLQATAEELKTKGVKRVYYERCDIRDPQTVEKFIKNVLENFNRIDVLVNNAGGQFPILAEALSPRGFEAVIKNNLLGSWNMTSICAKYAFIPQKSGRVVNVIAQVKRGFPGMVHTGAARAGVANFTKTLAVEWAPYNIKINAVAPGVIVSSGTDRYGDTFLEDARKATPLQRLGNVEEVSHLITYLSSEKLSSFITGSTFYIDGGQSLYGDFIPKPKL